MSPGQYFMRAPVWMAPLGFLLTTCPAWMPYAIGARAFLTGVCLIVLAFATFVVTYDGDGLSCDPPPPMLEGRARKAVAAAACAGVAVAAIGALAAGGVTASTIPGLAVALGGITALMMDPVR